MCSIFGILDIKSDPDELRKIALKCSRKLRHRGPDWSGIYSNGNAILAHERLAIVDVNNGAQPLYNSTEDHILAVNGEIYNHRKLEQGLKTDFEFQTQSDCEIILALYHEQGSGFLEDLRGMFAFILYDEKRRRYLIARDHMGIIPLYTGYDAQGNFFVASEMKALMGICNAVSEFPPGHFLDSETGDLTPFYHRDWMDYAAVKDNLVDPKAIREALEDSVKCHLMADVPYGVLLSGGLDSSLVAAIARKYAARRVEEDGRKPAWWPQLHSFAIGLEGSPDLKAARIVADRIDTVHHEVTFSVQEGLDALRDVIYTLETYDVTTVRASTPMYLLARKIKAMGIKMVLSGEGADEIFGGYLYFHKAPNAQEFHEELVRKLKALHKYDCLRANKSMSAWGVEARVPFLDKEFMDVAMRSNPQAKMCGSGRMEKHLLREAFAGYLPEEVLWRQKEQFSDGVGYDWIDQLKIHAGKEISDQQISGSANRFPHNPPSTKEAYLYREIFEEHFPLSSANTCVPGGQSVACSSETALAWDQAFAGMADPSGRAVTGVHLDGYKGPDGAQG